MLKLSQNLQYADKMLQIWNVILFKMMQNKSLGGKEVLQICN